MDCEEVKELLHPYNDRELTDEEVHEVTEHLTTCKECAFESTMIQNLKRIVKTWEGVEGKAGFRKGVLEKTAGETPDRGGAAQLLLAFIAAALVSAGIFFLLMHLKEEGISVGELIESLIGGSDRPGDAPDEPVPPPPTPTPHPTTTPGEEGPTLKLPAGAAKSIGDVTAAALSGNVIIEEPGGVRRPLAKGERIASGRSISTGPRAMLRLDAGDGYRVALAASSSMTVGTTSLRLRRGRMLVSSVAPGAAGAILVAGAYEIDLAAGEGKAFLEFGLDGTVRAAVLRGGARLRRGSKELGSISAGQQVMVSAAGKVSGPSLYRTPEETEPLE